ncbi:MAG: 50S ribosomal protein L10 [Gammaproteobacteria bacterium]
MSLTLEDKKTIVAEVTDVAQQSISAAAAEYRGLTVTELTQLRVKARESSVYLKVVRNTLARRAVEGTEFECMKEIFFGPLILAFSKHEPSAPARLFRDFLKSNEKLVVRGLSVAGRLIAANELDKIASLPTREEALASLMAVMKAPITKFVRTLAEPTAKLVRTIAAVRDQKQS